MSQKAVVSANIAKLLDQQRADYRAHLPEQLAQLEKLSDDLAEGKTRKATLEELHHRLHKLAGAGGTFGLNTLSSRALSLEQQVKDWLSGTVDAVDAAMWRSFARNVARLDELVTEPEHQAMAILPAVEEEPCEQSVQIWLVEDDPLIAQELVQQLESFNYEVRYFQRISDAEEAAYTDCPNILIMDVMFEQAGENATEVMPLYPKLKNIGCPLLFISSSDDFQSRVRASRLGAEGYFLKPLDVPRLINRLAEISERQKVPPQRVLVVDDDTDLAEHYRLVLLSAGMEVEVLSRPEQIIDRLEAFRPELVLMDLYMPDYPGQELAGVIRQYDNWASLPIVYLSAETDLEVQIQAVGRGADDFLTKPISDAQLVAAVRVRIERARQLSAQISRDSLTGLLKHAAIKEMVDIEVARSQRKGTSITVAMLDIDHFKTVNDTYGHAVGDLVISSVAMLLRQRLRRSDIIGRYGGEEFAVILPECSVEDAYRLLEDIRLSFSTVHFNHEGQEFTCTLSAGLASSKKLPDHGGAKLLVAADEALYVAKRGGRNQVQSAQDSPAKDDNPS